MAGGRPLNLTARELELLTALVEREGRIVSREELYRAVWGEHYRKSDRSVDVYVGKLRQKLDDALPGPAASSTRISGSGTASSPEPEAFVTRAALYIPFTSRRQVRNRLALGALRVSAAVPMNQQGDMHMRKWLALLAGAVLALGVIACGDDDDDSGNWWRRRRRPLRLHQDRRLEHGRARSPRPRRRPSRARTRT